MMWLPLEWRSRLPSLAILGAVALFFSGSSMAASCCGGSSATSLILPKFSRAMVEVSLDYEKYDGFWTGDGSWSPDPPGSDLNQYRLNLGYGHRLAKRWQASIMLPYVWNQNQYANFERNTSGVGDTQLSVWYEQFDKIACVWKVKSWRDLIPALYWGGTLTVPTGTSPYDDVQDNFDITGLGMYRLDANFLADKTIYPWNATFSFSYGKYLSRTVNQEYGNYVEPYERQRGDRLNTSLAFGYTYFTDSMQSITGTLAYTYLEEDQGTFNGVTDPTSGLRKQSASAILAWASDNRDWVTKLIWSHAFDRDGWGRNFPTTDIVSLVVSHVFR